MKTDSYTSKVKNLLIDYESTDKRKIFREDLGEKSIKNEVELLYNDILNKLKVIVDNAGKIEDKYVYDFIREAEEFKNNLLSWAQSSDPDFVRNRQTYIDSSNSRYKSLYDKWVSIYVCIIDESEILQNIYKFNQLKDDTNFQIDSAKQIIEKIKTEALEEVKKQAGEIKKSAQKTARNISVKSAQDQFEDACNKCKKSIWIWGFITFIMIGIFALLAYKFYYYTFFTPEMKINADIFNEKFLDILRWESIFHTVIRVTILAVVGTIIAFCLKMLRGSLHMFQHNLHRQRVANSVEAFVNAALTEEQSDRILEKLVEAVVSFGQSGLIQNEDDSIHASKLTIDSITKTLNTK